MLNLTVVIKDIPWNHNDNNKACIPNMSPSLCNSNMRYYPFRKKKTHWNLFLLMTFSQILLDSMHQIAPNEFIYFKFWGGPSPLRHSAVCASAKRGVSAPLHIRDFNLRGLKRVTSVQGSAIKDVDRSNPPLSSCKSKSPYLLDCVPSPHIQKGLTPLGSATARVSLWYFVPGVSVM